MPIKNSITSLDCNAQAPPLIRWHFKHNVFMLDEVEGRLEHLGGAEDYLLAAQLYEASLKRWPSGRIQMRQGARVVYDTMRRAVV